MVDGDARDQRQFGVDDRRLAGAQGEAKGAGHARRIEQRVNGQRVGGGARLFDPQRAEKWKFLALGVAGADRQAARVDAVGLAAREAAKKCRALEDRRVLPALAGGRLEHAHAGKAEVGRIGRRLQLAEIVVGAVVDQSLRLRRSRRC